MSLAGGDAFDAPFYRFVDGGQVDPYVGEGEGLARNDRSPEDSEAQRVGRRPTDSAGHVDNHEVSRYGGGHSGMSSCARHAGKAFRGRRGRG